MKISHVDMLNNICKVTWNMGVTWNAALSSASCSWTKTVRLTSWDGIGRYTSTLSYRGLQVSNSSFVGPFCRHFVFLCNQNYAN